MSLKKDLNYLRRLVSKATSAIAREYFLLPVADSEGGQPLVIYRERVYAYELYHQLQKEWPKNKEKWLYSLGGEVDKRGHPIVRGPDLDNVKPDLLVHVPGRMDHNLAVVEIKAVDARKNLISDDLRKLIAFRQHAKYKAAFLLAFGEGGIEDVLGCTSSIDPDEIKLVELLHHRRVGEPAEPIAWRQG